MIRNPLSINMAKASKRATEKRNAEWKAERKFTTWTLEERFWVINSPVAVISQFQTVTPDIWR